MPAAGSLAPQQPPRLLNRVREKIRLKHYSIRTEHAYVDWVRRFDLFHGKRHRAELGAHWIILIVTLSRPSRPSRRHGRHVRHAVTFVTGFTFVTPSRRHAVTSSRPLWATISAPDQRRMPAAYPEPLHPTTGQQSRGPRYAVVTALWLTGLLSATPAAPVSDSDWLTICHGYGCRYRNQFPLTPQQLIELRSLLGGAGTAEDERSRIAKAVVKFFEYASAVAPVAQDRGGNFPYDPDGPGRMDCIDHATSVSSFLHLLSAKGMLRFHRPISQIHRSFLVVFANHRSAQIEELHSRTAFAVDRWPYDYGREPLILETRQWKQRLPSVGDTRTTR